jgi:hypothetical protein
MNLRVCNSAPVDRDRPRDEVADACVHVEEERGSGYSMTSTVMGSPFDRAMSSRTPFAGDRSRAACG